MTEKKKRGRPKKVNTDIQNTDMVLPGNLGSVSMGGSGDVRPIEKVFKGNDGSVTVTIGPKQDPPERPYPSNWNELGKVAKLQWLTEHRK